MGRRRCQDDRGAERRFHRDAEEADSCRPQVQCCGPGIFIPDPTKYVHICTYFVPDPESECFPSRIRIFSIPDPHQIIYRKTP